MDALHQDCHVADAALAGQRLDAALAVVLEALGQPVPGLRGRRRLLEEGRVRVNGRQAPAAYRVRQGDSISLSPALPEVFPDPAAGGEAPRALSRQGRWQAFFKPAGWHSVSLAGGSGRSLEAAIPSLWPEGAVPPAWALLQRLDARTSGIVCAAVADDADGLDATVQDFRQAEAGGRCCKGYLALLSGCLEQAGPWIWRSAVWSVCWMPRPLMPPAGPGSGPCTAGRASPAVLSPANCAGAFLCPSPLCPTV